MQNKPQTHHGGGRLPMILCALVCQSATLLAAPEPFIPAGTYAISCGAPDATRWLANPLAMGGADWDAVILQPDYADTACAWRLNDEGNGYISVRNTRGGINKGDYIMKDSKIRLASTVNFTDYLNNQTFTFLGSEEECVVLSNAEANRHWSVSANGATLAYAVTPAESATRFRLVPLHAHDELLDALTEASTALADDSREFDADCRSALEQAKATAAGLIANPGYSSDEAQQALTALREATARFLASGRIPGTNNLGAMTKAERNAMRVLSLTGDVTPEDFLIIRSDMINLTELHIENASADSLPSHALAGLSNLHTVVLPPNLRTIGNAAFLSCTALTDIALPSGVEKIGTMAFARSGLRAISLGAATTGLGASAFDGCSALESISVEAGNPAFKEVNGMLLTADGTTLLKCPALRQGSASVPDGVKTIAPYALQGCTALSGTLQLPAGLESIGDFAFAGCTGLSGSLQLPESLSRVGRYAFMGSTGLSGALQLPASLTAIGEGAFSYLQAIDEVRLPEALTEISPSVFECCNGVRIIASASAAPPVAGRFALRGIDRFHTFIDVPAAGLEEWQSAPVWSEFENWVAPFEGYARFDLDGEYYIQATGSAFDDMEGWYLTYNQRGAGAPACFEELKEYASVWQLQFFNVTSAALPYAGGAGSDIRYRSGASYLHINMEGLSYSDPASTYDRRDNRTFAFWIAPGMENDECPIVAIQGNGTIFGFNDATGYLSAPAFSDAYPRPQDFLFRLVPKNHVESGIADVETPAGAATAEIYDLRGRRVAPSPQLRGIYIVRSGTKTKKIIL